jgi:hypothetical protein
MRYFFPSHHLFEIPQENTLIFTVRDKHVVLEGMKIEITHCRMMTVVNGEGRQKIACHVHRHEGKRTTTARVPTDGEAFQIDFDDGAF